MAAFFGGGGPVNPCPDGGGPRSSKEVRMGAMLLTADVGCCCASTGVAAVRVMRVERVRGKRRRRKLMGGRPCMVLNDADLMV